MPVGRKRLTARTVETLRPAAPDPTGKRNGRRFVMDAEVSGLGVKVTETGSRSYVLIKRFPGFKHPAPRQLGSCDVLSSEEAREKARDWLKLIARGVDPAQHERELQEAAARKRENSFAAVAEDFFREKLASERQGRDVERDMRKEFVTAWGKRPIADITDEDVLQVIRAVKQRGSPSQARNLLGGIDPTGYELQPIPSLLPGFLKTQNVARPKLPRRRVLKARETLDEDVGTASGFRHLDAEATDFGVHRSKRRPLRLPVGSGAAGLSVSTVLAVSRFRPTGIYPRSDNNQTTFSVRSSVV